MLAEPKHPEVSQLETQKYSLWNVEIHSGRSSETDVISGLCAHAEN